MTALRIALFVLWLSVIAALGPPSLHAETDEEFRRRGERVRRIQRALERVEAARRELADAQSEVPELAEAIRRERDNVRDIKDDTAEIERKQATFTDMLTTAFPWAASLLALVGGYAGGRKHEQRIVRKRGSTSGAGGGGAPRDRFRAGSDGIDSESLNAASNQG